MLNVARPILVTAVFLCVAVPARADLEQLGDALADVFTFGAWGQSRDTHRAEIELLKAQFATQLQREKNAGASLVATARIEEKAQAAMFAQFTAKQLLQLVGTIDVLQAQLKQVVSDRAKGAATITNFEAWFDAYVTGQDDQLQAFAALLRKVSAKDDATIDNAIKSALVASAKTGKDAVSAREKLREAVATSNHDQLSQVMTSLSDMRGTLKSIIEQHRSYVRQLVVEMDAEDISRRQLCKPSATIGVSCTGGTCSYYSPDPGEPLPCNGLTYLNAFPVSAVRQIFDNIDGYKEYTEFYTSLKLLGTMRSISQSAFRSPQEIFGDELLTSKLVPADFVRPSKDCLSVDKYSRRLKEQLEYVSLFKEALDRSEAARKNVAYALSLQPVVDFWLQDFAAAARAATSCSTMPTSLRKKHFVLLAAVEAIETFGSALTSGPFALSEDLDTLVPLTNLTLEF